MPVRHDSPGQLGPPGHLLTDQKERCDDAAAGKVVEHRRCSLRMGAIVECQRNAALVLQAARDVAGGRERPEDGRSGGNEPGGRRSRLHVISASTSEAADGRAAKERSTA